MLGRVQGRILLIGLVVTTVNGVANWTVWALVGTSGPPDWALVDRRKDEKDLWKQKKDKRSCSLHVRCGNYVCKLSPVNLSLNQ